MGPNACGRSLTNRVLKAICSSSMYNWAMIRNWTHSSLEIDPFFKKKKKIFREILSYYTVWSNVECALIRKLFRESI